MTVQEFDRKNVEGDLRALFDEVLTLCGDIDESLGAEIEGVRDWLSDDELRELLTNVLIQLRQVGAPQTDESRAAMAASVKSTVVGVVQRRQRFDEADSALEGGDAEIGPAATGSVGGETRGHLELFEWAGLEVRAVAPAPTFLGREVPLTEGFAKTMDILFWEDNKRLQLDLNNFRHREGRDPDPDELRELLWPRGTTLEKDDPYKIIALADDIAARGVRTPPVIDYWGTAWDGNRRLAACRYILMSPNFTDEQKDRASRIPVWQTSKGATKDQINAIVTSLNFGADFKLPWEEYIRARLVYDAYIESRDSAASRSVLSDRDETRIRQKVARDFGIRTDQVTRYCKMIVWALDFEDYHREQDRDEVEIGNRANALFQYFYELDAGRGDDKLAAKFHADEAFRAIVFDLMFDGKFKKWEQVRELRRVYETPEAFDKLKEAHAETSTALGQAHVAEAIEKARHRSTVQRQAGRGDDLARVTKWLNEDVTMAILRKLDVTVLRDFRDAARAVDGMITQVVEVDSSAAAEE